MNISIDLDELRKALKEGVEKHKSDLIELSQKVRLSWSNSYRRPVTLVLMDAYFRAIVSYSITREY
jgi:hypothetical protein